MDSKSANSSSKRIAQKSLEPASILKSSAAQPHKSSRNLTFKSRDDEIDDDQSYTSNSDEASSYEDSDIYSDVDRED